MRRNWAAILSDAKRRDLCASDVAREQKCTSGLVSRQAKRLECRLRRKVPAPTRQAQERAKAAATLREKRERQWRDRVARTPAGLTKNAFCRLHHCSSKCAERRAEQFGYAFAVSDSAKARGWL